MRPPKLVARRRTYIHEFEQLEHRLFLTGNDTELVVDSCTDHTSQDADRAASAINCFAYDIYKHFLVEEGNLLFSPLSISTALAMTYAGAGGRTADQMREVMHFGSDAAIHDAFEILLDRLEGESLSVANAIWPQLGFGIKPPFTNTVEQRYGGSAKPVDFANASDEAKETINDWVLDKTNGKIPDLLKAVSPATKLMLTNALHFQADWETPFRSSSDGIFTKGDRSRVEVPMMSVEARFYNANIHGHSVLELPYESGDKSMVIVLPDKVSEDIATETLNAVNAWMDLGDERAKSLVNVTMPSFETTVASSLRTLLGDMGMEDAFGESANFSGITDDPLILDQVQHKAFIDVNQEGTEAAAATAVGGIIGCFAAGTPVLTPQGETPIESIKAGDLVLARAEHSLESPVEPKVVEEVFEHEAETLLLRINGQTVQCTAEHPFYVKDRGWQKARELQPGDELATKQPGWVTVQEVATGENALVYNFRVADHKTYFVGRESWGFAIWTHNICGPQITWFRANRPFQYFIRDNQSSSILFLGRLSDPTQLENEIDPSYDEERATREFELPSEPIGQIPIGEPILQLPINGDPVTRVINLPGDANRDLEVNFEDFLILSTNFATTEGASFEDGDFNGDGAVNFRDFLIFSKNFGTSLVDEVAPDVPIPPTVFEAVVIESLFEFDETDDALELVEGG